MLQIEHFSKFYGDFAAVSDLSLHIAPGEIYGFIGHNGAGKTTLTHLMCGIVLPDEGEVLIDGRSVKDYSLFKSELFEDILKNNPIETQEGQLLLYKKTQKFIRINRKRCS